MVCTIKITPIEITIQDEYGYCITSTSGIKNAVPEYEVQVSKLLHLYRSATWTRILCGPWI